MDECSYNECDGSGYRTVGLTGEDEVKCMCKIDKENQSLLDESRGK